MDKKKKIDNSFSSKDRGLWKSYDSLLKKDSFTRDYLHREFPKNASELPLLSSDKDVLGEDGAKSEEISDNSGLNRRDFFKVMGAGFAFAGLTGCSFRKPKSKLYPYAKRPEFVLPGESLYYATSFAQDHDVVGLLVESSEGRPTKIEGNPLHSNNRGKTNHFHQASILDLYDPDRLNAVAKKGEKVGRKGFVSWMDDLAKKVGNTSGEGVGIVFPHQPSSVFYGLLGKFRKKFPKIETYRFDSVSSDNVVDGIRNISGKSALALPDYQKADVVVSLGCDFLSKGCGSIAAARDFANRRDPEKSKFNRLYVYENSFTITGGVADHRFRLQRKDIELLLYAIVSECFHQGIGRVDRAVIALAERYHKDSGLIFRGTAIQSTLELVVRDLFSNVGRAVIVAGADLPPVVHSLVFYLNQVLNSPISYYALPTGNDFFEKDNSLSFAKKLSDDLASKKITDLIVLDVDLVGDAPADLHFEKLLDSVNLLTLSSHANATTEMSDIVVPRSHYLEQWGDLVSLQGDLSVVQPLLRPIHRDSLSSIGFLKFFLTKLSPAVQSKAVHSNDYDSQELERLSVREGLLANRSFRWRKTLQDGIFSGYSNNKLDLKPVRLGFLMNFYREQKNDNKPLEVVFEVDYSVYDGRYANNAWLQELPDPVTKLTWDNAVIISKKTADDLGFKNQDVVELFLEGVEGAIKGPIWILPGQADGSVSLNIGYGKKLGKVSNGVGFSVSSFRLTNGYYFSSGLQLKKTKEVYPLASVQDHWSVDDQIFDGGPSSNSQNNRSLYRKVTYIEYVSGTKNFAKDSVIVPSLPKYHEKAKKAQRENKELKGSEEMSIFNEQTFSGEYQWGMSIDLSRCTGCNACVVACQAENNIPVVGKDMVLMGREMHWMRLDRYFDGDPYDPDMVHQPVACMHCEQAPCEQVCPVVATVHSQEGLNDMIYNRCIGTRFCANNCPYKVRRFNFFDYYARSPHSKRRLSSHLFDLFKEPVETLQLQFNPDVSVRMRGVMEKCTYCVQRINGARIIARNELRRIHESELETACQQACPSDAIVFGDISDFGSTVSKKKQLSRDYALLEELNVQPRTTYLVSLTNPNEKIKKIN